MAAIVQSINQRMITIIRLGYRTNQPPKLFSNTITIRIDLAFVTMPVTYMQSYSSIASGVVISLSYSLCNIAFGHIRDILSTGATSN
jgi:hypothetical protein